MRLQKSFGKPKRPKLYLRRIVGDSMSPTLTSGTVVILWKTSMLRVGNIVMVQHDGKEKIKRLAQVDAGRLFVLGDNAAHSTDSRQFGWLDEGACLGRLIWPRRR